MSDEKMWFGNRNYMQWIACPKVGAEYGSQGAVQSGAFLNGGAFHRQTLSAAKTFQLSWPLSSRDKVRAITDYLEGVYGEGAIYWSDPFNMDKNVLAQAWATPWLGTKDGVILSGTDVRPSVVPTSANSLGYPVFSANYSLNSTTDVPRRHWVPIPPGYTAWVGVHGVAGSGGKAYARTTSGASAAGASVELPILSVASTTRVSNSFTGASVDGIEVWIGGTGTITLSGIIVQVLPTGQTPLQGGFISGQGHSGCSFQGYPTREEYSAALDLVGLSANFIETEQWA